MIISVRQQFMGLLYLSLALSSAQSGLCSSEVIESEWQFEGAVVRAIAVADAEARASMGLSGKVEDATYVVTDTGRTIIVTISQNSAGDVPKRLQIRVRKIDGVITHRGNLDQDMTFDDFRKSQRRKNEVNTEAEPGATDNPDDTQRLREDH